jgi:hypothetical protein
VDERCERTDLLVSQCAHCKGNTRTPEEQVEYEMSQRRERYAAEEMVGWVPASFPGICAACEEPLVQDALIHRLSDVGWIGTCCKNLAS